MVGTPLIPPKFAASPSGLHTPKRQRTMDDNESGPVTNLSIKAMMKEALQDFKAELKAELSAELTAGISKGIADLEVKIAASFVVQEQFNVKARNNIDEIGDGLGFMGNKINKLENQARRQNLIFAGFESKDKHQEDCVALITHFCKRKFGIDVMVNRAYRLRTGPASKLDIIAHFSFDRDIRAIYKHIGKLKGSGVFIKKDLVGHIKVANETLDRLRRSLIAKRIKVTMGLDFLIYDGYRFIMDNQGRLLCSGQDGCALLSGKLGFDVLPLWEEAVAGKPHRRPHDPDRVPDANSQSSQSRSGGAGRGAAHGARGASGGTPHNAILADFVGDASATGASGGDFYDGMEHS